MKILKIHRWIVVICLVELLLGGCNSKPANATEAETSKPAVAKGDGLPDLKDAIETLEDSIQKPTSKFHLSYKSAYSGSATGAPVHFEADISPGGVSGECSGSRSTTWNGALGSEAWGDFWRTVVGALPEDKLQEAQPGVKYAGAEATGGFQTRRYDFDLATAPSGTKSGVLLGANAMGMGAKDYNVKGTAWISNDDGRMVKFRFDYIIFDSDGAQRITHYDVAVTK